MQAIDLQPPEWSAFLEGLSKIAAERERNPHAFQHFVDHLSARARLPGIIIDGANVAFYGQNWQHGHFAFGQIKWMVSHLEQTYSHEDILVVRPISQAKHIAYGRCAFQYSLLILVTLP